jgi:dTMP kinase
MISPPELRPIRSVAIVGIDGSGKTTQAHRLADALAAAGRPAVYLRNAGGRRRLGAIAVRLGRRDADHLLGRRAMVVVEVVLRWLALLRTVLRRSVTGEVAVMDRYAVCQYAGLRARGASAVSERWVRWMYRPFPRPDLTILLTVEPATAYDRIEARGYDHEEMSYLAASTAAYRSLPEAADFLVVDGDRPADDIAAELMTYATRHRVPKATNRVLRVVVTTGSLIAGLAVAGSQLAESF